MFPDPSTWNIWQGMVFPWCSVTKPCGYWPQHLEHSEHPKMQRVKLIPGMCAESAIPESESPGQARAALGINLGMAYHPKEVAR